MAAVKRAARHTQQYVPRGLPGYAQRGYVTREYGRSGACEEEIWVQRHLRRSVWGLRGDACTGNRGEASAAMATPAAYARGYARWRGRMCPATARVVPDGGARSATLERMSALSRTGLARGQVSSWAVPDRRPRWLTTGWRLQPAFFAHFLCGGKESECRPAQGRS
jgi:hypothetical protein